MHEVSPHRASDVDRLFPDWRYDREFIQACEKDEGKSREEVSANLSRFYCERDVNPSWEYVEGYADVRGYMGPPLKEDYTVFYRALAIMPISD